MENLGEIIFKTLNKIVGQINIKTGRKKVKDTPKIKSLKDKRRDTAKRYEQPSRKMMRTNFSRKRSTLKLREN